MRYARTPAPSLCWVNILYSRKRLSLCFNKLSRPVVCQTWIFLCFATAMLVLVPRALCVELCIAAPYALTKRWPKGDQHLYPAKPGSIEGGAIQ